MQQRATRDAGNRRAAIIFDFDGTIADSFEYVLGFLMDTAGNTTKFGEAELKELRKMSMRHLAIHVGVPLWKLPFTYFKGRRVMRAHMEHVQPFDGMIDVIRKLHQDGFLLFIASSNSSSNIRMLLRNQGVLSCFRAIRSGAGITGKPALIGQLMVRYRLSRRTTWYVGDEVGDIISSDRAGIRSLPVCWGFADPQRLKQLRPASFAESPTDILRIVEE
jgi:phosphoglycolate phosphatase